MSSRARVVASWLLGQAPTLVVLCGLAAVGFWGAANKWELPSLSSLWGGKDKDKDKPDPKDDDDKKDPASVTLDDDGAERAGLEHAPAREQPLDHYVEAPAVLAFDHIRHAEIASPAAGTVWRVLQHEGSAVKKGDLLGLIAAPDVGTAKAEFLNAWIGHEVKLKTLQRLQGAGDAIPERQVREAELVLREAKVRLVNAQMALVNVGLPLHLENLRSLSDEQVARKVRLLGLHRGPLSSPKPVWGLTSEEDLPGNLLPLVAPFDGLVIRCEAHVGEGVVLAKPVFIVSDVHRLSVMMDIRQEDAPRLALHQKVIFRANVTGQTVSGDLHWISAQVDPKTRTVRARAEIDNPDGTLRPATFGRARILVRSEKAALTVPDDALQWDRGSYRVFVRVKDNVYDPRVALRGQRSGGQTQLLDARTLQAASLLGSFAGVQGPLPGFVALPVTRRVLREVRAGDRVVTTGSQTLQSELVKHRIGED
jgi:cobalt-zinc-cadmium efflux system membrane fusion protein